MKPISEMQYHPLAEDIVKVLCAKTQNESPAFYRLLVAYNFCKVASMMRISINTHDRGLIPINAYAVNLASSGFGKGHSTNIMEDSVLGDFREKFLSDVFPLQAELNLRRIAARRSIKNNSQEEDELTRVEKEFYELGPLPFAFDSGTAPAVKQVRQILLMADAGALCFEMDELGSNLSANAEVLSTFLELYDVGKIKSKLTKNTSESKRSEDISGRTPANMMLYGTPSKLFDGGATERLFMDYIEAGYGRRAFYAYSTITKDLTNTTAEDLYERLTAVDSDSVLAEVSQRLADLADRLNFGAIIEMDREVNIMVLEYKLQCERNSLLLPEHEEIKRAEMQHRFFKALKLAGAYAFIDGSAQIHEEHLYAAIRLAEDSGEALTRILKRERNYIRLAKYLAEKDEEVTHPELMEDLPYYPSSATARTEMLNLAIAWGYRNNIIIRRKYTESVEFLKGESLKKTDLNALMVAYSDDYAHGYSAATLPFLSEDTANPDDLITLCETSGYHFTNHYMRGDHRSADNVIAGFNFVVLDVDGTASLEEATTLLDDYYYIIYTTKSHTATSHRFRIILPISHILKLEREIYIQFMKNLTDTLPFEVDFQANQPERKWAAHAGDLYVNYDSEDGTEKKLFDVMPYIPETSRNDQRKKYLETNGNLSALERWFVNNTGEGNRNNNLYKYGTAILQMGWGVDKAKEYVTSLNSKLPNSLSFSELSKTVFKSLESKAKKLGVE